MKNQTTFKMYAPILVAFFCLSAMTPVFGQWERHVIDNTMNTAVSVDVADLDGDTKLDLVVTDYDDNELILYLNNYPDWTKHIIDSVGATFAFTGDMDGDDTLDVVACVYRQGKLVWYENNHPTWTQHIIDPNSNDADYFQVADIDADGTLDVLTKSNGYVVWYENPTWTKHNISSEVSAVPVLSFIDVDGDGLQDVKATLVHADKVVWYKNEGNGLTWTKHMIDDDLKNAWGISSGDLNGDNNLDIVATRGGPYNYGTHVVWYENHHPTWTKYEIDAILNGANIVDVTDVDGDGSMDIIADGFNSDRVVWYENNHPNWTRHLIGYLDGPRLFFITDVDGDSLNDIIVPGTSKLVWYKHPGAPLIDAAEKLTTTKVYPNPFHNELTISINDPMLIGTMYSVLNLSGQVQKMARLEQQEMKVDLNNLSNGVYLLQLSDVQGRTTSRMIIKN